MDSNGLKRRRMKQHAFNGEMRVMVNKRIYPNMDQDTLWDILSNWIDGGKLPEGIKVETFSMRDDNIDLGKVSNEYYFASSATTIEANPVSKKRN